MRNLLKKTSNQLRKKYILSDLLSWEHHIIKRRFPGGGWGRLGGGRGRGRKAGGLTLLPEQGTNSASKDAMKRERERDYTKRERGN